MLLKLKLTIKLIYDNLFFMKLTKSCKLQVNLLNTNLKLSLKINIHA